MVEFTATAEERNTIGQIADRAYAEGSGERHILAEFGIKRIDLMMDIEAAHSQCPLDLQQLLAFPDFDFCHDLFGIINHLDRSTGKLQHCFLPRCAKRAEVPDTAPAGEPWRD